MYKIFETRSVTELTHQTIIQLTIKQLLLSKVKDFYKKKIKKLNNKLF